MKNFLFVDDHPVVRSGIRKILGEIFAPVQVSEASNGEEALRKLAQRPYDLALIDVILPDTDTISLVTYIKKNFPDTKVLMLSMAAEKLHAKRFLMSGANGFISKTEPVEELSKAINTVLNGRNYISSTFANTLVSDVRSPKANLFNKLSAREYEIANLLLAGKSVTEMAASLKLGVSTIGTYKARIFEKLNISHILELKELSNVIKTNGQ